MEEYKKYRKMLSVDIALLSLCSKLNRAFFLPSKNTLMNIRNRTIPTANKLELYIYMSFAETSEQSHAPSILTRLFKVFSPPPCVAKGLYTSFTETSK